MLTYLYETTVLTDPTTSVPLRLAAGAGYNDPSAPGYFSPVIMQDSTGAIFTKSIYQSRLDFGLGALDAGVISFAASSDLDWLADGGFGQPATLKLGDSDAAYNTFTLVATGVASNALIGVETGEIGWQDRTKNLDKPISTSFFAGTNVGSTGLEGLATDIKNQRKPRCWGKLDDIEPILLNGPQRIYGWNYTIDGTRKATATVRAVRVRGSAWTPWTTPNYANAAALQAASITVGYYATCLAESLIKMGGSASIDGAVRVDVTIGATTAANYTGAIVTEILTDMGEAAAITGAELAAIDTAKPYLTGYYTADATARDCVTALLNSVLAWGYCDQYGAYRFGFIPTSLGTASVSLRRFGVGVAATDTDVNIISLSPLLAGAEKGVPAKSVQVRFGRRWGAQEVSNLATGLTDAEKATYSTEWQVTDIATSSDVENQFTNADDVVFDTLLYTSADAVSLRDALASLLNKKEKRFSIDVVATASTVELFRPGILVNVFHERFGMQNGYQCVITKVRAEATAQNTAISLELLGIDYV